MGGAGGAALLISCVVWATGARAGELAFQATLEMDLGSIAPFTLNASGSAPVAPDGSFTLQEGLFAITATLTPPQTSEEAVRNLRLQVRNGQGQFGGPGNPGGVMPLLGSARIRPQPAFGFPDLVLDPAPIGSPVTRQAQAFNGSFNATAVLFGASFQTGRFRQVGFSVSGSQFDTRTNTGVDGRTPGGAGQLTLVVPARLEQRVAGSFDEEKPMTAVLRISFVPEPHALLLHMVAISGVLALGVARAGRSGFIRSRALPAARSYSDGAQRRQR